MGEMLLNTVLGLGPNRVRQSGGWYHHEAPILRMLGLKVVTSMHMRAMVERLRPSPADSATSAGC